MNIILIVETFIAFVLAITLHEAVQAAVASALGDPAPAGAGRMSLIPARQMSAVGTIVAIVYSFAFPFSAGLGWGRPLSVDARRLRVGPNFGLIVVALSGIAFNLLLGVGIAFGLSLLPGYALLDSALTGCQGIGGALQNCLSSAQPAAVLRLDQFLYTFAVTNVVIAIINIIPLHPLDGYKILFALLPSRQAISLRRLEPYMELILLVILFVIPWLMGILNIPFDPGQILIRLARSITDGLATSIASFYILL